MLRETLDKVWNCVIVACSFLPLASTSRRLTHIELDADVGPMVLDCSRADAQLIGDLFTGLIFGQQNEDTPLGRRQLTQARLLLGERGGSPRAGVALSASAVKVVCATVTSRIT